MRHGRPPGYPDFSVIVRTLNSNGLAQREIARRLHVSVATVCRWRAADTQPSIVCGCQLLELAGIERPDVPGIR
jgi:transcriptional regulator with XRE-family HTH domain